MDTTTLDDAITMLITYRAELEIAHVNPVTGHVDDASVRQDMARLGDTQAGLQALRAALTAPAPQPDLQRAYEWIMHQPWSEERALAAQAVKAAAWSAKTETPSAGDAARPEPLSDVAIADVVTGINPYPRDLVEIPAEQLVAFVRGVEAKLKSQCVSVGDRDTKDAARYRWLRSNPQWLGWEHDFRPDEVEREIDAAMAAAPEQKDQPEWIERKAYDHAPADGWVEWINTKGDRSACQANRLFWDEPATPVVRYRHVTEERAKEIRKEIRKEKM